MYEQHPATTHSHSQERSRQGPPEDRNKVFNEKLSPPPGGCRKVGEAASGLRVVLGLFFQRYWFCTKDILKTKSSSPGGGPRTRLIIVARASGAYLLPLSLSVHSSVGPKMAATGSASPLLSLVCSLSLSFTLLRGGIEAHPLHTCSESLLDKSAVNHWNAAFLLRYFTVAQ